MNNVQREAEAIELYLKHLEAQEKGDRAGAQQLLRASAALGEPMALHAVAFREPRIETANALYRAAAAAGYAPSAWNLYLYFDDAGDKAEADRWLERAASLGDQDALKLLRDSHT